MVPFPYMGIHLLIYTAIKCIPNTLTPRLRCSYHKSAEAFGQWLLHWISQIVWSTLILSSWNFEKFRTSHNDISYCTTRMTLSSRVPTKTNSCKVFKQVGMEDQFQSLWLHWKNDVTRIINSYNTHHSYTHLLDTAPLQNLFNISWQSLVEGC